MDNGALYGQANLIDLPPPSLWDDVVELDPEAWPRRVERHYQIVPTVCFNCESACGLLAYVDKETGDVRKFAGHPLHPGSLGRNCAKGPATLNQIENPDRILYPLRRTGARGEGKWERVSWDQVLDDLAGRIRNAIQENRLDEVVYHVGRPGEDLYTERVLTAWGVDGHNSHTNVCSAGARAGYAFWMGMDRPDPDHEHARFILLMSSHLESGHYFQPHAQRIVGAKVQGTRVAVVDTRLSNTASQADYWLAPWPGTEAGLLLAMASYLIQNRLYDRAFLERWVNWRELMEDDAYLGYLVKQGRLPEVPADRSFEGFLRVLEQLYGPYTFAWAEAETGVPATQLEAVAQEIGRAGTAFASHIWRNAAAGNRGGWMIARCLLFLNVLTGSVATKGGTIPNSWAKFVPRPPTLPAPVPFWNEVHFPLEFPLSYFEMSFCLPHLLKQRDKRLEVYFTRVYNPVWTNPDGFSWIEMFQEPQRIGLHVALTPVWSETAQFADYVLPMGMGPERHDLHSYETHASQWIGFRQPVSRVAKERRGQKVEFTYEANPGEVWEENEFWIELSWRIDPDGSLGIRQHFQSPYRPHEKITIEEYYRWIFEHSVPGLPDAATREGLSPLEYMRRYGAFEVTRDVYAQQEKELPPAVVQQAERDGGFAWTRGAPPRVNFRPYPGPFLDAQRRFRVGVEMGGKVLEGYPTPSGRLEFFSTTLRDWGWPEYAVPIYPRGAQERHSMQAITSHVHWSAIDQRKEEYLLLPTFRLPTLIHTRTNGAKWLYETANCNPVWIHPADAQRMGVETGDLVQVETEIGRFVDRAWVTEAIRPGVVACSHHLGRWRLFEDHGSDRWNSALVRLERPEPPGSAGSLPAPAGEAIGHGAQAPSPAGEMVASHWRMRQIHGPQPFESEDPDSGRIWWSDGGVHQNLVFPVQPDPVSGQHCWHQKVRVTRAPGGARYGDIEVDSNKAYEVYRRWLEATRPGPGPGGFRRPYWMMRPLKPALDKYTV